MSYTIEILLQKSYLFILLLKEFAKLSLEKSDLDM